MTIRQGIIRFYNKPFCKQRRCKPIQQSSFAGYFLRETSLPKEHKTGFSIPEKTNSGELSDAGREKFKNSTAGFCVEQNS